LPEKLSEPTRELIRTIAGRLKEETGGSTVLLTGPHALGVERPTDKLYFLVITDDEEGVIEHRFLERYGDIDKEMEIGIFPRKFVDILADRGYWDMVSFRAIEALRAAVPVVDPTAYGRRSIDAMARHLPKRQFVSGQIHKVVATFDDAMSLYSKGDYEGAVLVVREALRLAVELVVGTSGRSPGETTDQAVRRVLGEETYSQLLQALDIEGVNEEALRKRLDDTLEISKGILKDAGVPVDFLSE
jgi:hypothetical protein